MIVTLPAAKEREDEARAAAAAAAVAAAVKAAEAKDREAKDTTKSVRARIREEEMKAAEKRESMLKNAEKSAANGYEKKEDSGPPLAYQDTGDSSSMR